MVDVKAFREELGLSQMALAELLGVNQATISRFENDSLPMNRRTALALEAIRASRKPAAEAA